ncbi:hypothetical protein BH10BAC2_BH10BAC2_18560 [soil metagenome]
MGQQVLIIDDDTDTCKLLSRVLLKVGYNADTAFSGIQGLEKFNEKHYDIILCDYNMGDSNGLSVLKKVKERKPGTIVIIMTGYLNSDIETALKANGAFDYITKPIYPEVIFKVLKEAIDEKKSVMAINYSEPQSIV